jgi:orotate phosphoribosyltransferase
MNNEVLQILKKVEAIITDSHFVLTSGKHAAAYINKDALYPHTKETSAVCRLFAEAVKDLEIDTVVGPALGGIILSQWTAHHLSKVKGKEVFGVYTEKTEGGGQIFTRGYDKFVAGKKVLVVEDLTSTGGSAKKVVDAVKAAGGQVVGVCVMVNRNLKEVTAEFLGAPFFPLAEFEVQSYDEVDCPLCKSNVLINTSVGHGKEYLESKV